MKFINYLGVGIVSLFLSFNFHQVTIEFQPISRLECNGMRMLTIAKLGRERVVKEPVWVFTLNPCHKRVKWKGLYWFWWMKVEVWIKWSSLGLLLCCLALSFSLAPLASCVCHLAHKEKQDNSRGKVKQVICHESAKGWQKENYQWFAWFLFSSFSLSLFPAARLISSVLSVWTFGAKTLHMHSLAISWLPGPLVL